MTKEMTKQKVLKTLVENGVLENKKLIALCNSGSRLYNLANENSDYDFTVIYLPTLEDIYFNHKGHDKKHDKILLKFHDVDDVDVVDFVDISLIDLREFLLDLGKPSLKSLEKLYDTETLVEGFEDLYAPKYFLDIFTELQENVEDLFTVNTGGMFNALRGQMYSRKKDLTRASEPAKEYMHFLRVYFLLMALHNGSKRKEYVTTDGSLVNYRLPENVLDTDQYVRLMDAKLKEVNDKEFSQSFNKPYPEQPLKEYHIKLLEGLKKLN